MQRLHQRGAVAGAVAFPQGARAITNHIAGEKEQCAIDIDQAVIWVDFFDHTRTSAGAVGFPELVAIVGADSTKEDRTIEIGEAIRSGIFGAGKDVFDHDRASGGAVGLPQLEAAAVELGAEIGGSADRNHT